MTHLDRQLIIRCANLDYAEGFLSWKIQSGSNNQFLTDHQVISRGSAVVRVEKKNRWDDKWKNITTASYLFIFKLLVASWGKVGFQNQRLLHEQSQPDLQQFRTMALQHLLGAIRDGQQYYPPRDTVSISHE